MNAMKAGLVWVGLSAFSGTAWAEGASGSWLELGIAVGGGTVEYDCTTAAPSTRCTEGTGLVIGNLALTAVGDLAFRVRYSGADDMFKMDGDNPGELAVMVGLPFGDHRGPIVYAGLSRVFNADDNIAGPTNGVAAEITMYRWGSESVGGSIGLQGAIANDDLHYGAFNVSLRFGTLRGK